MPLSRKTKKARKMAEARKNESPEEKEQRLIKNRIRSVFRKESQKNGIAKVEQIKKHRQTYRRRESIEKRQDRLEKMREYSRKMRAAQTSDVRQIYLKTNREYNKQKRERETMNQRQARLNVMRKYSMEKRKGRTLEGRQVREYSMEVRMREISEEMEARLQRMNQNVTQLLDQEFPFSREIRLTVSGNQRIQIEWHQSLRNRGCLRKGNLTNLRRKEEVLSLPRNKIIKMRRKMRFLKLRNRLLYKKANLLEKLVDRLTKKYPPSVGLDQILLALRK